MGAHYLNQRPRIYIDSSTPLSPLHQDRIHIPSIGKIQIPTSNPQQRLAIPIAFFAQLIYPMKPIHSTN